MKGAPRGERLGVVAGLAMRSGEPEGAAVAPARDARAGAGRAGDAVAGAVARRPRLRCVRASGSMAPVSEASAESVKRVFLVGATGYIGRAVVKELVARGHSVVCFARPRAGVGGALDEAATRRALAGAEVRFGDVRDAASVKRALRGERFDAVISCLATRSGEPEDAWRIEHGAQGNVLAAAEAAGVARFVLLSAICVQKPRLAFQHAKLAFEAELAASGLRHAIVRPTAFFKSLSGQIPRVKAGKPFLVFGDGELTACTPISERDLARFLVDRLGDAESGVFPIGGPGPAITPRAQAELLFELLGEPPRIRRVPLRLFDAIVGGLGLAARVAPPLRAKAELARIGRYYATESMLLWDEEAGRYDADATPAFGEDTLRDHYERVLREGLEGQELGDHAVF